MAKSQNIHLTSGSITPQLLQLCLPLLAGNVLQQLYNIINSLVVTHYLGNNAFAALGVAESVMNLFIYAISGACMGASVLIARFYGEKDFARLRQQIYVTVVLIGGCTLGAVAVGQLFLPQLLHIIQTPAELYSDVSTYLRCILVGMLFTFTYNFLAATLRAVGNTRTALYFLLISLGYNLVCAWFLVAVLKLGILGTALATASAQLLSSLLCLLYIRKKQPFLRVGREDMKLSREMLRETSGYSVIAALQQSSLYLGKLMVQSAVNGLGTAAISGFTAATRVENFIQAFGISGCESIAIFVSQNKGAKEEKRALQGFLKGGALVIGMGVFFSAALVLFGDVFVIPFLDAEETTARTLGGSYLQLLGWFYFLSFTGHAYVGHFRGVGRMNITFWGTTTQIAVRVVGTYLLVDSMGLNATALATGIGWVVIVIFHTTCFLMERPFKKS